MEKRNNETLNFHAFTWQLISRDAWQAAEQNNHQYQLEDQFHAIEQEKTGVAEAESKNPCSNQERRSTFRVIGEAQILCFAGLYTGASDGPPRDQVEASFLYFLFSTAVTKTGG